MYLLLLTLYNPPPILSPEEVQCKSLATYYITMGVMEECERSWLFVNYLSLDVDTRIIEARIDEMALDCPPITDLLRFPGRVTANKGWMKAMKFRTYMEERVRINPWPAHQNDLEAILEDANWRTKVWDALDNVHLTNDMVGKRVRLQRLRALIGRDNYDQGLIPEPLSEAALKSDWYKFEFKEGW